MRGTPPLYPTTKISVRYVCDLVIWLSGVCTRLHDEVRVCACVSNGLRSCGCGRSGRAALGVSEHGSSVVEEKWQNGTVHTHAQRSLYCTFSTRFLNTSTGIRNDTIKNFQYIRIFFHNLV